MKSTVPRDRVTEGVHHIDSEGECELRPRLVDWSLPELTLMALATPAVVLVRSNSTSIPVLATSARTMYERSHRWR